jgi:hypothetical protein
MSDRLERRAREARTRALIRSWEYRQRHHAKGVWFRLRRLLAGARAAFAVPEAEARRLVAEGHRPEPVGEELEPPKTILFVTRERLEGIAERRELPVRLGSELLAARFLVLVAFEEEAGSGPAGDGARQTAGPPPGSRSTT